ncbi:hypothetical protein V1511DRAFT_499966 [Dipodascopsis uninucleata]
MSLEEAEVDGPEMVQSATEDIETTVADNVPGSYDEKTTDGESSVTPTTGPEMKEVESECGDKVDKYAEQSLNDSTTGLDSAKSDTTSDGQVDTSVNAVADAEPKEEVTSTPPKVVENLTENSSAVPVSTASLKVSVAAPDDLATSIWDDSDVPKSANDTNTEFVNVNKQEEANEKKDTAHVVEEFKKEAKEESKEESRPLFSEEVSKTPDVDEALSISSLPEHTTKNVSLQAKSATSVDIHVDKLSNSTASFPSTGFSALRSFSRIPEEDSKLSAASSYQADDAYTPVKTSSKEMVSAADDQIAVPEVDYQDLPPELISMTDHFIESVQQITTTTNLSPEKLSELFQEFYVTAQEKATSILRRNNMKRTYEVQMMSMEELAKKKRERRQKEAQKLLYEELVEKKVCEVTYDRIFMFHGSDDEAKDTTLDTKIAALKLINIGMEHLGVSDLKDVDIHELLSPAGQDLMKMNSKKSPKDKLQLLISAHKHIVDALVKAGNSSQAEGQSGADSVLPALIFCVIEFNPPHIASNLAFIQRFRAAKTVNGETAYCLTNFEAVVAFLETVDLTTLKLDPSDLSMLTASVSASAAAASTPIGTTKPVTQASTPISIPNPLESLSPDSPSGSPIMQPNGSLQFGSSTKNLPLARVGAPSESITETVSPRRTSSITSVRSRSISSSRNSAASPFESKKPINTSGIAASAASTADHGFKSIGSTFESSYKFLFGGKGNNGASSSRNAASKGVQMKGSPNPAVLERRTQEVLQSSSALLNAYQDGTKRDSLSSGSNPPPYPGPPSDVVQSSASIRSHSSTSSTSYVDDNAMKSLSGGANTYRRVSGESSRPSRWSESSADNTRSNIFASLDKSSSRTESVQATHRKLAKPLSKFARIQNVNELTVGDLDDLLKDYKRMVLYLRSISAFED